MTLTELMRILQDLGAFIVFILLAYVIYRTGILIEVMSDKIKGEKGRSSGEKMEANKILNTQRGEK